MLKNLTNFAEVQNWLKNTGTRFFLLIVTSYIVLVRVVKIILKTKYGFATNARTCMGYDKNCYLENNSKAAVECRNIIS